jgi:hypothetical protein
MKKYIDVDGAFLVRKKDEKTFAISVVHDSEVSANDHRFNCFDDDF